ncbi:MAG: DUF1501 domain-containing protein [Armatimonadota bacterium]
MKHCSSFEHAMSRRTALKVGAAGLIPWLLSGSALSQVKLGDRGHNLVVIFLRGGSDGLNMLVPYADDNYYKARPSVGIPVGKVEKLNDYFGLHPSLKPFKSWYEKGELCLTPAVGSQDRTRSHFEAMVAMETGSATGHSGTANGWLARYLTRTQNEQDGPLRSVAWADTMPDSLRGAPAPLVVQSVTDFRLDADAAFLKNLESMYKKGDDSLVHRAGELTLDALKKIEQLDPKNYRPSGGAAYADDYLGKGLKEVSALIKSKLGLEIACLETTGWDTHFAQGADTGFHANNLASVANNVDAFLNDLGDLRKETTVVIMTEFGRRIEENASLGTDHGRASVMMVFNGVNGGKIDGVWPGIGKADVDEVGDLKPVNDYRQVLTNHLGPKMPEIAKVWA